MVRDAASTATASSTTLARTHACAPPAPPTHPTLTPACVHIHRYASFDWDGLVNLTLDSPWRPSLTSAHDTTCFDEAEGGDSLDGPAGRTPPDELAAKWDALRTEYAADASGADDCAHLC